MTMDETKLRDHLEQLTGDAGLADPFEGRTLTRARRRRFANAAATSLLVAALLAGGLVGVRAVMEPAPTVGGDPSPAPQVEEASFPGLWPESDAENLAVAQAAADDGHSPLRTTAEGTATMFATNLLGWSMDDVIVESTDTGISGSTTVGLLNRRLVEHSPPIDITLRQLGRAGPQGVWSVVAVASPLVEIRRATSDPGGSTLFVVAGVSITSGTLEAMFLELPAAGDAVVRVDNAGAEIEFEITPGPTANGRTTLFVAVREESGVTVGATLGAVTVAAEAPVGSPSPTATMLPAIHLEGAPPDVAVTAQRLLDGVLAHDLDALAELIDPNTFVHDFDDGSDPIPGWRVDPMVLDAIPGVLRLPFVIQDIEGYGTFYVWPYLVKEGALDDVTEQESADLHSLGFSDAEIERMREFGGYFGPRLAIDADGVWRNYVTGGTEARGPGA